MRTRPIAQSRALRVPRNACFSAKVWNAPCYRIEDMRNKFEDRRANFTYTELGRSIDEFELDLLEVPARGVNHERLADGDHTLLGTRDGALEHEIVVLDDTVVREATHRGDRLFGDVVLSRRVRFVGA
jgi:hypothetical protein